MRRFYPVLWIRYLILVCLVLSWFIAMVSLLVAVKVQVIFQPQMLWFSLLNASELLPVFDSAISPFWKFYVLGLSILWFLLAWPLQFLFAKASPSPKFKKTLSFLSVAFIALLLTSAYFVDGKGAYKGQLLSFWLYNPAPLPSVDSQGETKQYVLENLRNLPAIKNQSTSYDTVVLLILESARTDWLDPSYGMKNLQAFAAQSLVFHNAYTTVSHSSKALYSIFCGLYPTPTMVVEEARANRDDYCLGHWLNDIGFHSLFLQSAQGSFESREQLIRNVGLQDFIAGEQLAELGAKKLAYLAYDDAYLPEALAQYLPEHDQQKLFLSIFTSNTHHPYYSQSTPCTMLPEQCYRQTAEAFDKTFSTLQAVINKHRNPERTLWLVVGDHGEAFAEKGQIWHDAVPFEEVVNVPLLVHGRTVTPGHDRQLRSLIDIPLSITDYLQGGSGLKHWSMAKSLLDTQGHDAIFSYCFYPKSCRSIRSLQQKIIIDEKFGNHLIAAVDEKGDVLEDQLEAFNGVSPLINNSEQLKLQLRQFHSRPPSQQD